MAYSNKIDQFLKEEYPEAHEGIFENIDDYGYLSISNEQPNPDSVELWAKNSKWTDDEWKDIIVRIPLAEGYFSNKGYINKHFHFSKFITFKGDEKSEEGRGYALIEANDGDGYILMSEENGEVFGRGTVYSGSFKKNGSRVNLTYDYVENNWSGAYRDLQSKENAARNRYISKNHEYSKWPMGFEEKMAIVSILEWMVKSLKIRVRDICDERSFDGMVDLFIRNDDFNNAMEFMATALEEGLRLRQERNQPIPDYLAEMLDGKSIHIRDICELDGKVADLGIPEEYKERELSRKDFWHASYDSFGEEDYYK